MKREEFENLRNLSLIELQQKKNDIAKKLFESRFQLKLGQLKNYSSLKEMRKDISRINIVIRQKQINKTEGANGQKK
ncbi:MAG: 50S ribosomal protein L29 [Candidatus Omnitrophica bacterium]|jgi:large subunit ribosomal protein L29|nr:50S ribosomal protein L29 [Candidatus Omnitrophota bacterium]